MPHDDALFADAIRVARASPNRIRHVGAVLVPPHGSVRVNGYNTWPAGVRALPERLEGDGRFIWMEHAERNAIYAAARAGIATEGASLASSYFPCTDCARAIVQAGITQLHTLPPDLSDPVWGPSFVNSRVILEEAGVQLHFSDRDLAEVHASSMEAPNAEEA